MADYGFIETGGITSFVVPGLINSGDSTADSILLGNTKLQGTGSGGDYDLKFQSTAPADGATLIYNSSNQTLESKVRRHPWETKFSYRNLQTTSVKNALFLGSSSAVPGDPTIYYFTESATLTHATYSTDSVHNQGTFTGNITVGLSKNGVTVTETSFTSAQWTAIPASVYTSISGNTYIYKFDFTDTSFVEGDYVEFFINAGGAAGGTGTQVFTNNSDWVVSVKGYSTPIDI